MRDGEGVVVIVLCTDDRKEENAEDGEEDPDRDITVSLG